MFRLHRLPLYSLLDLGLTLPDDAGAVLAGLEAFAHFLYRILNLLRLAGFVVKQVSLIVANRAPFGRLPLAQFLVEFDLLCYLFDHITLFAAPGVSPQDAGPLGLNVQRRPRRHLDLPE